MKRLVEFLAVILFASVAWQSAGATPPQKFEFSEGQDRYYALAVIDSENWFVGFRIFDSKDQFIQLVDCAGLPLASRVPEYIQTAFHAEDFNFDGYPDIALPGDGSGPHSEYFDIWLWDSKQKKFVEDQPINDAQITRVDSKTKRLYSVYSYHGFVSVSEYTYSSEKLLILSRDVIDPQKNSEVKEFYSDGKITKTVTSVPKWQQ